MKKIKQGILVIMAMLTVSLAFGQTNLNFIAASVNNEGAIKLTWNSKSNETYEVDEADALNTNADGTTQWNFLYGNYPSQGSNTFWLDTGNYYVVPAIVHPKNSAQRFYRIKDLGPDTTSDEPIVSVADVTNGSVLTGGMLVTVDATTDQATVTTKLYVDGEEQKSPINETNIYSNGSTNTIEDTYLVNSCEWFNGSHVIYATSETESGLQGGGGAPIATGHGVSPFVNTVFSNLVTGISFSQHFFDPSLGQTQIVSAVFAANVDWTLTIEDIYTNVVFTTNGSGGNMAYPWDGNGTGEVSIPNGVYYYYISAVTNGLAYPSDGGGGGGSPSGPPSPEVSRFGGGDTITVVMPPLPPGLTNDGPDTFTLTIPHTLASHTDTLGGGASPDDSGISIASQDAPQSPQRNDATPAKGVLVTFGIAYQDFAANGTNGFTVPAPPNPPVGGVIRMNTDQYGESYTYSPLHGESGEIQNFVDAMFAGGGSLTFLKSNDQFGINDLKGSASFLNTASVVVFSGHGDYGNTMDARHGEIKQMYFPITSGTSAQYLDFTDMNLGGSGTNGLKWMVMDACFSLYEPNWNTFGKSSTYKPYNSDLHMILGYNSTSFVNPYLLEKWAQYMTVGATKYSNGTNSSTGPQTVINAWFNAGFDAYHATGVDYATTVNGAYSSSPSCLNDNLRTNSTPSGTFTYLGHQFYP